MFTMFDTGFFILMGIAAVLILWAIVSRVRKSGKSVDDHGAGRNAQPSASAGASPQVIAAISSAVEEYRKDNGRNSG